MFEGTFVFGVFVCMVFGGEGGEGRVWVRILGAGDGGFGFWEVLWKVLGKVRVVGFLMGF